MSLSSVVKPLGSGSIVVRTQDRRRSVTSSIPSHDIRPYFVVKLFWDITTTQINSVLHPFGVAKSSTSFGWGKGEKVTAAGWQVTLSVIPYSM